MGFLKFLKRDKKKGFDLELANLDAPPAPPDFSEEDLGSLPELPELPELEKPIFEPEKPFTGFKAPQTEKPFIPPRPIQPSQAPKTLLELQKPIEPRFPAEEEWRKPPSFSEIKPEMEQQEPKRTVIVKERYYEQKKEVKGPIFIRVEKFKDALDGITLIKSSLKEIDETLSRLDEIEEGKNKHFDIWSSILTDLQKKLLFVDETFFKR